MEITKIPYSTEVKKIIHISDIHIQLYKRHTEYQHVFEKLYDAIRLEKAKLGIQEGRNTEIPLIIVLTGDLLHSKSDLSPECINVTYHFLKNLAGLAPLIVIPGNHDVNMNNKERLDSITPILYDLPSNVPLHYFRKSGTYQFGNLIFQHASIFDYHIVAAEELIKLEEKIKGEIDDEGKKKWQAVRRIMLFHGKVNGAMLFHGVKLDGSELDTVNNKTITPSSFTGYDMALLGDIHKYQTFGGEDSHGNERTTNIAYAGSLIQQNHGETVEGHGYLLWDVAGNSCDHREIANDWNYVTLAVKEKVAEHVCFDEAGNHLSGCGLAKNLRVRIHYSKTPESFVLDYLKVLKLHHNILEYSFLNVDNNRLRGNGGGESGDGTGGERGECGIMTGNLTQISDPHVQNKYLKEFLTVNSNANENDIKEILELNIAQNKLLHNNKEDIHHGVYKLIKLEFGNLFCYSNNNIIDFTNLNGIVGIIAQNHIGKSSILDIILYTLYDKFSRKGTVKDILNNRKQEFYIKLSVKFHQWIYHIEKRGVRSKKNREIVTVKVGFTRVNVKTNELENLEQDSAVETKKLISDTFGDYEDMINTSFSIQNDNCCFIDAENTKRKSELERILKFDFLNELGAMASTSFLEQKKLQEYLEKKLPKEEALMAKKQFDISSAKLELVVKEEEAIKKKKEELQRRIKELAGQLDPNTGKIIQELQKFGGGGDRDIVELAEYIAEMMGKWKREMEEFIRASEKIELEEEINDEEQEWIDKLDLGKITVAIRDKNREHTEQMDKWLEKIRKLDKIIDSGYQKRKPVSGEDSLKVLEDKLAHLVNEKSQTEYLLNMANDILPGLELISAEKGNLQSEIAKLLEEQHLVTLAKIKLLESGNVGVENNKVGMPLSDIKKILLGQEGNMDYLGAHENFEKEYLKNVKKWYQYLMKLELDDPKKYFAGQEYQSSKIWQKYMESGKKLWVVEALIGKYQEIEKAYKGDESGRMGDGSGGMGDESGRVEECDARLEQINLELAVKKNRLGELEDWKQNYDLIISKMDWAKEDAKVDEKVSSKEYFEKCMNYGEFKNMRSEWKTRVGKLEMESKRVEMDINNKKANMELDAQIAGNKETKEKYVAKMDAAKKDMKVWNIHIQAIQQFMELKLEMQLKIREVDEKIGRGRKWLDTWVEHQKVVEQNMRVTQQIEELEEEVAEIDGKMLEYKKEIQQLIIKKNTAMDQLEQFAKDNQELKRVEKMKNIWELYKGVMKQLPMLLLDKITPILEFKINELLSVLTDFTIKMEINDTKIDIYLHRFIFGDNRSIIINNASGYERFISSLAIRVALLEINNLPRINFIAIDEGWSCFDNHNINNVNMIMDYLSQKFDFVITMSHLTSIKEFCDTQINIKRDDQGYSHITF